MQLKRRAIAPARRARADRSSAAAERTALVAQACRLIESAETSPSLDGLAASAGMSSFHFHRVFKAETGLTPKAYASAFRARRLRQELNAPNGVGHGCDLRRRLQFQQSILRSPPSKLLGMRARDYRAGGTGAVIRFAVGQCSLGAILVAQSQRGICAILLDDDPDALVRELQDQFPKAQLIGGEAEFEQLISQVVASSKRPRSA